MEILIESCS